MEKKKLISDWLLQTKHVTCQHKNDLSVFWSASSTVTEFVVVVVKEVNADCCRVVFLLIIICPPIVAPHPPSVTEVSNPTHRSRQPSVFGSRITVLWEHRTICPFPVFFFLWGRVCVDPSHSVVTWEYCCVSRENWECSIFVKLTELNCMNWI